MSELNILILDNLNKTKEELSIIKPNTYQDLLNLLEEKYKNISNYELFIFDFKNNEIKINNENYDMLDNILFIREKNKNALKQSLFEINYNKLSESKRDILDDKYNCILCSVLIKNENPFLCYKCQKIFHEKCIKDWDKKCNSQNKNLTCPNCRNELPIEKWNRKIDYEDKRKEEGNSMNVINKLNEKIIEQNELIQKYEVCVKKTLKIFQNIISEIDSIHKLLNLEKNNKLTKMINEYPLDVKILKVDDLYNYDIINEELKKFKFYLIHNNNKINNNNEMEIDKNENEIKLIYFAKKEGYYNVLGKKFIENNKDNFELYINDKKISPLSANCLLQFGNNIITLIIKNKLENFSYMFHGCNTLNDITELEYLDVKEAKDFSYMFFGCSSLSALKSLKNWNVSNCENFEYMFSECSSLNNLKGLDNWNVSNSKNFGSMFFGCSSLPNLNNLKNWNVKNCVYFDNMFRECSLLTDIKALNYWNVSNGVIFKSMFSGCMSLSNINPLQKWNLLNCMNLESMFYGCSSLSDLKPLQKWDVSNCQYYTNMFYGCITLYDLNPLKKWKISKGKKFKSMFFGCSPLMDINSFKNTEFKCLINNMELFQKDLYN